MENQQTVGPGMTRISWFQYNTLQFDRLQYASKIYGEILEATHVEQ